MVKRNEKQNVDRKFKDIAVGDRIFVKNNIRRHKFVSRYSGPFRVMALKGSTVFCYSLASKKHKQVTMDKVRYAGDLSQEDAPDIIRAFPEEEPSIEEESVDQSQRAVRTNTDVTGKQSSEPLPMATSSQADDGHRFRNNTGMSIQQKVKRDHRYNLRNKN